MSPAPTNSPYDETMINGVLHYRHYPDEPWTPYSIEALSTALVKARASFEEYRNKFIEATKLIYDVQAILAGVKQP